MQPSTDDFPEAELPVTPRPAGLVRLPLAPVQETWLTMEKRFPGGCTPLVHLAHRLRGPLMADALVRAVGAVVDRHESLRFRFDLTGEPVQVVDPPRGLPVERIDLAGAPEAAERAREQFVARLAVPFDFERGGLVRSCLVRLADDDHVWLLAIHHILADGASLATIAREVGELYQAFAAGTRPRLPQLSLQYGDFAVWSASERHRRRDEEDRAYWVDQLAGAPPLELPTRGPRPAAKGAPIAEVSLLVEHDLAARVAKVGQAARCSTFMVLLSVFQMLLARWSGQLDFCVGMPVAGSARNHPEIAPVVGQFNNMVPVRADLSGKPDFAELLARTRSTVLDALDHQDFAFPRILAALGIHHDPGRYHPGQALLIFEEFAGADDLRLPGIQVEDFPVTVPKMPYDLMVYAFPVADGLRLRFFYDTALFTADTMFARTTEYRDILRAAVADR